MLICTSGIEMLKSVMCNWNNFVNKDDINKENTLI